MGNDNMTKKTALDLACKRISCINNWECADCKNKYKETYCIDRKIKYFQQQADIPDGWEVVKEIYENLYTYSTLIPLEHFIKQKLQQAGIEV